MTIIDKSKKLDEILIKKDFNLDEAISSLKFYWTIAKRNNETLVMELWREKNNPEEKGG